MKKGIFYTFTVMAIIALGFAFVACGEPNDNNTDPETPEYREATINLDFGGPLNASVKGELTATQWEGLATRLETIIQTSYNNASRNQRRAFVSVFETNKAVIEVVKDATFSQWSVSNCYLILFNFDYLAGQSDEALATIFIDIAFEMSEAPLPEVAGEIDNI